MTLIKGQLPDRLIHNPEIEKKSEAIDLKQNLPIIHEVQILEETYLDELPLPTRVINALERNNIETVSDLEKCSENELFNMKQIGVRSLDIIKETYYSLFHKKLEFKKAKSESNSNLLPQPKANSIIMSPMDSLNKSPSVDLKKEYITINLNTFRNEGWLNKNKYLNSILADEIFLDQLNLHPRMLNALNRKNIYTIADLKDVPIKELANIKSIGKFLLINLSKELNNEQNLKITKKNDDQVFLNALLCRISEGRDKDIIIRRYGFATGEKQTLDEIGKDYKITRERVRQLQEKMIRKLKHPQNNAKKRFLNSIEEMFLKNGGIITDEEADIIFPQTINIGSFDGSSVLDLLSEIYWIWKIKVGDVSMYMLKFQEIKPNLISDIFLKIKANKFTDFSIGDLKAQCKNDVLTCNYGTLSTEQFFDKLLRIHPLVQKINNKYTLYSQHPSIKLWINLIEDSLKESGTPLHFTEISEHVNNMVKNNPNLHLDVRRAHSLLIESNKFAHTGVRGTYGLVKWGIRKDSTLDLIVECLKKAGFPLHAEQIFNYVSKYKDTKLMNIKSTLTFNQKFKCLGNGMYDLNSKFNNEK